MHLSGFNACNFTVAVSSKKYLKNPQIQLLSSLFKLKKKEKHLAEGLPFKVWHSNLKGKYEKASASVEYFSLWWIPSEIKAPTVLVLSWSITIGIFSARKRQRIVAYY